MAFKVTVLDKDGKIVERNRINEEVCELWGVAPKNGHWCQRPGEGYCEDWDDLLGHSIFIMRMIYGQENTTYSASDLFKALVSGGCWHPKLELIEKYNYEIQLLFFWIEKEYEFKVENDSMYY